MHRRMYTFLKLNNILQSHQFGFQCGYSTTNTLLEYVENACKNVKSFFFTVLLDFRKAFDTVNHSSYIIAEVRSFGC